jgi:hypothetical protein
VRACVRACANVLHVNTRNKPGFVNFNQGDEVGSTSITVASFGSIVSWACDQPVYIG